MIQTQEGQVVLPLTSEDGVIDFSHREPNYEKLLEEQIEALRIRSILEYIEALPLQTFLYEEKLLQEEGESGNGES